MSGDSSNRSALRVVAPYLGGSSTKRFCGHCGRQPGADAKHKQSRVCPTCGLGLILEASADIAPSSRDPFLVVDQALSVCAVSREAERLLGISETDAVNQHVARFLSPGDADSGENPLLTALALTSRGEGPTQNLVVRPSNTFGVRYWARIGRCGPPSAALVVLADAS